MLCNNIRKTGAKDVIAAITCNWIRCAYQPVRSVDGSHEELYQEGLARLLTASGKVLSAGAFVPQVEASGNIIRFDHHMLGVVLDDLQIMPSAVLGCNLSAETMQCSDGWRKMKSLIGGRGELASRLVLELTETQPVFDPHHLNQLIAEARKLHCKVAIDDFGTGYLSPTQLLHLEPDIIKIDASLLWRVRGFRTGPNTLRHIVGFASCVAPVVVIEGVESVEHFEIAKDAGATHVQGYHIAVPELKGSAMGVFEAVRSLPLSPGESFATSEVHL
ncbi:EAL domain-containing protein [Ochrobactrum sp. AN78]|uniref:EAL domain-containing protein n=1 Tax=Ochrobactrum sp. AN78 TaxID=3039853 RepID=UPI002989B83D|nr:EAL domain-containing protein [Ochrobactrum sp. AN78]MDH7791602.1 EAL domain-containing protein (putative c-di-GMP-specific phosphodiesterase class I) [Ochrobactrum sp. AN78]